MKLDHKAMWEMKKLKIDCNEAVEQRLNGLNELDEFHLKHMRVQTSTKRR